MSFRNPSFSGYLRTQQARQMASQYKPIANMIGGYGGAGMVMQQMGAQRGLPMARRPDPYNSMNALLQALSPSGYGNPGSQTPTTDETGEPTRVVSVQGRDPLYVYGTPQYGNRSLTPPITPEVTPPATPQPMPGRPGGPWHGSPPINRPVGLPQLPAGSGTHRPVTKPGTYTPGRPRWLRAKGVGYL